MLEETAESTRLRPGARLGIRGPWGDNVLKHKTFLLRKRSRQYTAWMATTPARVCVPGGGGASQKSQKLDIHELVWRGSLATVSAKFDE
jgi:hypothetical protein